MFSIQLHSRHISSFSAQLVTGALLLTCACLAWGAAGDFGPSNPFYAPSTLVFQAPAFDKIKDEDFQPAIEAAISQQQKEIGAIANNPDSPTFENTLLPIEKSGQLLQRVMAVFNALTDANTNPTLQKLKTMEAPKLAAHEDFIPQPEAFRTSGGHL